jgi:hypothetical protein
VASRVAKLQGYDARKNEARGPRASWSKGTSYLGDVRSSDIDFYSCISSISSSSARFWALESPFDIRDYRICIAAEGEHRHGFQAMSCRRIYPIFIITSRYITVGI